MALLEARGLTVTYGGVHANDGIDLECEAGRLVGLIGPNGAGKTTLIDAITGFTSITEGTVTFDGRNIGRTSPSARARLGLARTFQSLELFDDLSVRDNLLVAAERPAWYSILGDVVWPGRKRREADARVEWAIDTMDLRAVADVTPDRLSHGQRKLVSMARAFAGRPKLVLLDEPAAGLDTAESEALGALLRAVLDDGISLLLVDHDMRLVLGACDDIYVLDFGVVIAHGPPAAIRSDEDVIAAYLGTSTAGDES